MKLDFQIGPVNKAGLQIFSILALSWVTSSGNCGYYAAVLCVQYTLYPQTQTAGNKITKLRQRPDPRAEAQKPKTFRIAAFYAQNFSGRSTRINFFCDTLKKRVILSRDI